MITDCISNWNAYAFGATWDILMPWIINNVNATTPEGEYNIGSCTIKVFSTTLRLEDTALYEAHRTMCDLHMVIAGESYFWCRPVNTLELEGLFDSDNDIGFYKTTLNDHGVSRLKLTPKIWTLVFPWDAHLPDMVIDGHTYAIKKLVAKIPLSCFEHIKKTNNFT